jgi:hypothetical protein
MPTCHRHYPGRSDGACSLVPLHRQRPSLCNSQVGSCDCCFGACSAFTHVMACTLAGSPSDPFHRKLRQLCYRHCRFDCYRVERTSSRAGVAPAEVQRLFTAHCYVNNESSRLEESNQSLSTAFGQRPRYRSCGLGALFLSTDQVASTPQSADTAALAPPPCNIDRAIPLPSRPLPAAS